VAVVVPASRQASEGPAGDAAGYSIDGISYCTFNVDLGFRVGPTTNGGFHDALSLGTHHR